MADLAGVNGLRENFKVVGARNVPGKLSNAMATGVAKFGIDYTAPGMLHAKFLRSPYANAKILSIDCSKAREIPGVVDVVTWDDEDMKRLGAGGPPWELQIFLDNIADMPGVEVGAIVVAESEDICEEALKALEVEWEVYPHVIDLHDCNREDMPVLRPDETGPPTMMGRPIPTDKDTPVKTGNINYAYVSSGDIETGFAEADHTIEYSVYIPAVAAHLPNPPASIAWWTPEPYKGEGDSLHIEGAVREKDIVSIMYNITEDRTIQEGLFMGGKYCDWGLRRSQKITPLLAKRSGRPVRCADTRQDTFDFLMSERYIDMKIGFRNDGTLTAIDDHSLADNGARGSSPFGNVGDLSQNPYNALRCKNFRTRMEIVDSNRGVMRLSGQFCPYNWDVMPLAMYLIAESLDMDPIDVTLLNVHGPDSKDDPRIVPSLLKCIEEGKKMMNWEWHKSCARKLPDGRMHGMSFRYQMCPRHTHMGFECSLEYRDGIIRMPTQGPAFGVYAVECNAMVVAEELGVKYDEVNIDYDSRARFRAWGGGSDGTTGSAWIMKECAYKLKQKILEAAIRFSEDPVHREERFFPHHVPGNDIFKGLKPDDLDIVDSRVIIKADPDKGLPLAEATDETLYASHHGAPPPSVWRIGQNGLILDVMNTTYCEVAVDTETGEVEILRFGAVADPGLVLRPISLESQIDQVMFFSQGCQLTEEYIYDRRTGVMLTNNMIEYKKPGILDIAPVDQKYIETRGGNGVYGANGISHSMANHQQVINAIHNAVGVWVEPPATPAKILKALGKA